MVCCLLRTMGHGFLQMNPSLRHSDAMSFTWDSIGGRWSSHDHHEVTRNGDYNILCLLCALLVGCLMETDLYFHNYHRTSFSLVSQSQGSLSKIRKSVEISLKSNAEYVKFVFITKKMCLLCVNHFQIVSYPTKTAVLRPLCHYNWVCVFSFMLLC